MPVSVKPLIEVCCAGELGDFVLR